MIQHPSTRHRPEPQFVDYATTFHAVRDAAEEPMPDTERSPAMAILQNEGPSVLGAAIIAQARAALENGIREDLGRNDGTTIRLWAARFGVAPPCNWCAIATSTWLLAACEALGLPLIVSGSAVARALGAQFEASGRWMPVKKMTSEHLTPGTVVVWARGNQTDPDEWRGHVGVVEFSTARTLHTIEGNSGRDGNCVSRMERSLDDPSLLGFGLVNDSEPTFSPSPGALIEAARLMALGVETMQDGEPRDPLAVLDERLGKVC